MELSSAGTGANVAGALRLATVLLTLASGCRAGPAHDDASAVSSAAVVAPQAGGKQVQARAGAPHMREDAEASGERFTADWFPFTLAAVSLDLVDLHGTRELESALSAPSEPSALFVVNAGFFDTRGAPLGLSIAHGVTQSAFSRPLSGGVLEVSDGKALLFETETYDVTRAPTFAVQCRPRLVVARQANVKRDDGKRAERTAICLRERGSKLAFVLAKSAEQGPSLYALGRYLATKGCDDALALDGGPSTGAAFVGPRGHEEIPLRGPIRQAIRVSPHEGGAP